jgi:UDP-glucose 4-epimerase
MVSKILITGGAGFLGSHLAKALVNKGYDLIIVDNLSRGNYENINTIIHKINFVNGDIIDFELMQDLIKSSDTVFHLAALSRVIPSIDNPQLCFKSNIEGTEIIARLCSHYGKKLVFSSSREVYGTAKYIPVDEEHPLNPENPYGTSKVAGEKIIESYSKCYNLKYAILRLANVYGDRDFDRVIPIFIKNSLNNKDLIIYGGQQIIDFVYITDVIEAFLKAFFNQDNLIVNIGSGKGTTLLELANIIKEITKNKGKITIEDKRTGEVEKYISKINKSHEILDWKPEIYLKEGIKKLL